MRTAGHAAPIHSVQYARDGRLLVSAGGDGAVKVWSVGDMEVLLTLCGHSGEVMQLCKTAAGNVIATASENGELAFWDLRYARELTNNGAGGVLQLATH